MRRPRWRIVFASLLLGAATNMVIAWSIAIAAQRATGFPSLNDREDRYGRWMAVWRDEESYFQTNLHRSRGYVTISESGHYPGIYITSRLDENELRERLPGWSVIKHEHSITNYPTVFNGAQSFQETASGWPFLCVRSRYLRNWEWDESLQRARITLIDAVGTIRVPRWAQRESDEDEYIPSLPLAAGFAANSAFYAVLCALPFLTRSCFRAFRSRSRRRRHSCPACGYPIGVSPNCSECGLSLHGGAR